MHHIATSLREDAGKFSDRVLSRCAFGTAGRAQLLEAQRELDLGSAFVQPAAQSLLNVVAPAPDGTAVDFEPGGG